MNRGLRVGSLSRHEGFSKWDRGGTQSGTAQARCLEEPLGRSGVELALRSHMQLENVHIRGRRRCGRNLDGRGGASTQLNIACVSRPIRCARSNPRTAPLLVSGLCSSRMRRAITAIFDRTTNYVVLADCYQCRPTSPPLHRARFWVVGGNKDGLRGPSRES